jgi:hypothetical protein
MRFIELFCAFACSLFTDRPPRYAVSVPGIRFVHAESGVLGIEWIDGASVRKVLGGGAEGEEEEEESEHASDEQAQEEEVDVLKETYGLTGGQSFNPLEWQLGWLTE